MIPAYQLVTEVDLMELDPTDVYRALCKDYSYLLQSAEGGEKIARYSFIGLNPALHITADERGVYARSLDCNIPAARYEKGWTLEAIRSVMENFDYRGKNPARFAGGLVGYLAYDAVRHYAGLPENKQDALKQPDAEFILARNNIIYDHAEKKTYVTENYFKKNERQKHEKSLEKLADSLIDIDMKPYEKKKQTRSGTFKPNITKKQYENMVEKARDYIKAGDVFQVVLSQRLTTKYNGNPFDAYQNLKTINPSPYMYYLDFKQRKIAGSSPEMLARVEGRNVVTYPIAGTRSRGRTVREDKKLETEMQNDAKEKAEHTMLVDLGRNDIGRIAQAGTVKVKKLMQIEKYSHVQHMVSEVTGKLKPGLDGYDALKSIFP
ncbi:MAG: anthranilate synthase component I family protein, partial [Candidatus Altiarchaeota archaeon]|nr:anthranilate synthase component I family protein [Candidatus Altiarchaeota archaeon]